MTTNKLYSATVVPKDGLGDTLKRLSLSHLTIYNHALEILRARPDIWQHDLQTQVVAFVEINNIPCLNMHAVRNELYYLYKKFRKQRTSQKHVTSIQYFTLILRNLKTGFAVLDETRTKLKFAGHDGYLELPAPMEEIHHTGKVFYMNLSYSTTADQFVLSLFEYDKLKPCK